MCIYNEYENKRKRSKRFQNQASAVDMFKEKFPRFLRKHGI